MPDHPEYAHLWLEQGDFFKLEGLGADVLGENGDPLLNEDGGPLTDETSSTSAFLVLEQNEGAGLSRLRQEGEPYMYFLMEDGTGDILQEVQPRAVVS